MLDRALTIQPSDAATKATHAVVDLDWKADTRPLHRTIDEIRVKDPAALQSVADSWLICALAERDPAAAAGALSESGENALGDGPIQFSRAFLEGVIARMMKDDRKAKVRQMSRGAFPDAPARCSYAVEESSSGFNPHCG